MGRNFESTSFWGIVLPVNLKTQLYISLVRSHLCYCSQIWRPNLIKDITNLECIQRKATKFILNDYASDYKSRLEALQMLPLTLWFELQDIMFLVKCLQDQTDTLNINRPSLSLHPIQEQVHLASSIITSVEPLQQGIFISAA